MKAWMSKMRLGWAGTFFLTGQQAGTLGARCWCLGRAKGRKRRRRLPVREGATGYDCS